MPPKPKMQPMQRTLQLQIMPIARRMLRQQSMLKAHHQPRILSIMSEFIIVPMSVKAIL
nr:MAG TPA: hypothetical protein [Caudoviricetes sp.]